MPNQTKSLILEKKVDKDKRKVETLVPEKKSDQGKEKMVMNLISHDQIEKNSMRVWLAMHSWLE